MRQTTYKVAMERELVNAEAYKSTSEHVTFEINPRLDPAIVSGEFQRKRRLRFPDFLDPRGALAVYKYLACEVDWNIFLASHGKLLTATVGSGAAPPADFQKTLQQRAYDGASYGLAFLYEADRLFPEDVPAKAAGEPMRAGGVLVALSDYLNSGPFLALVKQLTGTRYIHRVDIQATRYRPGYFSTYQTLPPTTKDGEIVSVAFTLTLTPEWVPEWGGLLQFWSPGPSVIEAYSPSFNTLDLYSLPQGHWIAPVSAFAASDRLAIVGRIYQTET
jgi:SM-20-related protein